MQTLALSLAPTQAWAPRNDNKNIFLPRAWHSPAESFEKVSFTAGEGAVLTKPGVATPRALWELDQPQPHPTPRTPRPLTQPWGPEPGPSSRFLISPSHMASSNGEAAPLGGGPGPFRPDVPHTSSSCSTEDTTTFCHQGPDHQHPTLFSGSVGHISAPPHNDPAGAQVTAAARAISPRHPSPTQGAAGPHRDQDCRPNQSWHPQLTALAPHGPRSLQPFS